MGYAKRKQRIGQQHRATDDYMAIVRVNQTGPSSRWPVVRELKLRQQATDSSRRDPIKLLSRACGGTLSQHSTPTRCVQLRGITKGGVVGDRHIVSRLAQPVSHHPHHVTNTALKRGQREDQRSTNRHVVSENSALEATETRTFAVSFADRRHENCFTWLIPRSLSSSARSGSRIMRTNASAISFGLSGSKY